MSVYPEDGYQTWKYLQNQDNCASKLVVLPSLIFVGCAEAKIIEVYERDTLRFVY